MSTDLIVSYDGTPNDDDALALGKMPRVPGRRWRSHTCATRLRGRRRLDAC
jgi:hypothetical protein